MNFRVFIPMLLTILSITACSQPQAPSTSTPVTELKQYPLNNLDGVLTQSGVELDASVSSDGGGSLKITTTEPTVVRLFETGDVNIENARLTYHARIRTEGIEGQVFLEMWCQFSGQGEFFSRGLDSPVSGTTEWVTQEIPFFLQTGQNPSNVKLNLVVNGKGTAWIDEIRLLAGPI